jgi:hypothetical protein
VRQLERLQRVAVAVQAEAIAAFSDDVRAEDAARQPAGWRRTVRLPPSRHRWRWLVVRFRGWGCWVTALVPVRDGVSGNAALLKAVADARQDPNEDRTPGQVMSPCSWSG